MSVLVSRDAVEGANQPVSNVDVSQVALSAAVKPPSNVDVSAVGVETASKRVSNVDVSAVGVETATRLIPNADVSALSLEVAVGVSTAVTAVSGDNLEVAVLPVPNVDVSAASLSAAIIPVPNVDVAAESAEYVATITPNVDVSQLSVEAPLRLGGGNAVVSGESAEAAVIPPGLTHIATVSVEAAGQFTNDIPGHLYVADYSAEIAIPLVPIYMRNMDATIIRPIRPGVRTGAVQFMDSVHYVTNLSKYTGWEGALPGAPTSGNALHWDGSGWGLELAFETSYIYQPTYSVAVMFHLQSSLPSAPLEIARIGSTALLLTPAGHLQVWHDPWGATPSMLQTTTYPPFAGGANAWVEFAAGQHTHRGGTFKNAFLVMVDLVQVLGRYNDLSAMGLVTIGSGTQPTGVSASMNLSVIVMTEQAQADRHGLFPLQGRCSMISTRPRADQGDIYADFVVVGAPAGEGFLALRELGDPNSTDYLTGHNHRFDPNIATYFTEPIPMDTPFIEYVQLNTAATGSDATGKMAPPGGVIGQGNIYGGGVAEWFPGFQPVASYPYEWRYYIDILPLGGTRDYWNGKGVLDTWSNTQMWGVIGINVDANSGTLWTDVQFTQSVLEFLFTGQPGAYTLEEPGVRNFPQIIGQ